MSKESMEITINTSKWHEHAKQWNGNSHISSLKLTGSHFIVILFTLQCQLYIWEQSHPFSSIVAFVYKLLHIPCIFTSNLYSNVTTSTRINSSSVHTYILVCFIRNFQLRSAMVCLLTNNSTWCQNRGCICISSVRRTYGWIQQFPAYIQSSRQVQ